jgi:hypothetical protein
LNDITSSIPQWLLTLVESSASAQALRAKLLFHGTCEPIEGRLRPGGYDGVFWTSDSPMIAQSYIPASGGSQGFSFSLDHRLSEPVQPPDRRCTSVEFSAAIQSGHRLKAVEYDDCGRVRSYAWHGELAQWPRVAQVLQFVEALGYRKSSYTHGAWIKTAGLRPIDDDPAGRCKDVLTQDLLPQSYRMAGQLWMLPKLEYRWTDIANGKDSDLTDLDYHKTEIFRRAQRLGFDGMVINDFAQTDHWGNLGHVSYGLFESTLHRLYEGGFEPFAIDAQRFSFDERVPSEMDRRCPLLSKEFDAFFESTKQAIQEPELLRYRG